MTTDPQEAAREFLEATEDFPDSEWADPFINVKAMRGLCEENARLQAKYADLLNLVIQPWTRDGDGAKLWKVNLSWTDTTKTREEAVAMVERCVARKKEGGDA